MPIAKDLRLNEQIRTPQVRVIDQNNDQIGIISTAEALTLAREAGMDLVEVAPTNAPPVCRLMDYGKWKYDQKKKSHKAKLKQHSVVLKEVRLRPKTDEHDRQFKVKKAREFLEKGDKVQFTMLFRGREMAHTDQGRALLERFVVAVEDIAKVDKLPSMEGRKMNMVLARK